MRDLSKLVEQLNDCVELAKKLTTKERKALKSSTFCGPNRSFPVNDCKHVGTAKAYLGRSKFSAAQKARIAACINRKAKSLGCTPGKPAKAELQMEFSEQELQDFMNDPIWKDTVELIQFFEEQETAEE
jgi:hypothetical protein